MFNVLITSWEYINWQANLYQTCLLLFGKIMQIANKNEKNARAAQPKRKEKDDGCKFKWQ
jgi:hypothetical protein